MCDCYLIGGPFIGADPNCPLHGTEATLKDKDFQELMDRVSTLEKELEKIQKIIGIKKDK